MTSRFLACIALVSTAAFAQGPRGPQTNHPLVSGLDLTKVQIIEGAVSAVNIGYGLQYPSIQINAFTIKLAPVWFLLENNFEIKAGDKLKVSAAPSLQSADPYWAALALTNNGTGASITLRDANGFPLWTRNSGHPDQDPAMPSPCLGCSSILAIGTATGIVDQYNAGIGIQMPSIVLKTADGNLLNMKIGPERVLMAADFSFKVGDFLSVRYAVTAVDTVALDLTNSAGVRIVLRNDDLTPAWH